MKASLITFSNAMLILVKGGHALAQTEQNIWPNFRGVNCSGTAGVNQDPPVVFGSGDKMVWKLLLPEGHSSPCIVGDNIFLAGFSTEGKKLRMFCIDRRKGSIKWEKQLTVEEFEKANPVSNPATATPATDGKMA